VSGTIGTDALALRYGTNPHQTPASVFLASGGALPFEVLNGAPGYINLLDALNAWQLVRELRAVVGLPAAASFKHVSPAGAAVGVALSESLRRAYFVPEDLSPLASAYARARGADRVSSYGDWAALSDSVDVPTAKLLQREVSDGVIAPAYEAAAVEILKQKRGGRYTILQIDLAYEPPLTEHREVFGITFSQQRNTYVPDSTLPRDAQIAQLVLKYTQSNSVCLVHDGQAIGIGAGQQSRIACTRLACDKADLWYLRQHPDVLNGAFPKDRVERDNAIDERVRSFPLDARRQWLATLHGVTLGSDAFIPFRDNVDRAAQSGVSSIIQPGGAVREDDILQACREHNIEMTLTGVRLFQH
jgi:phosphoribosylaminoimidazolecarboxamide formyltransferase / IMP cyclohydrolase